MSVGVHIDVPSAEEKMRKELRLFLSLPVTFVIVTSASAQSVDATASQEDSGGQVIVTAVCKGQFWAALNDDPIQAYSELRIDGQTVASGYWEGWGQLDTYLSHNVQVDRQDREILCFGTDSVSGAADEDTATIPRRRPDALLNIAAAETFTLYSFGDYERYREYQVMDNYARDYNYSGTSVTEQYTYDSNGCNISIQTASTTLNNQGRFNDRYTTGGEPIPACSVAPSCETSTHQFISIEGSYIFGAPVIWRCDNVSVGF